jgi:four helix bundle protein
MHDFRQLEVWKKSIQLCKTYYFFSKEFPKDELFGLISQSRRSLYSIPSNIAEGAGRDTKAQFSHFLNIALGSSFEFETQIIIAKECEFFPEDKFQKTLTEIQHIQNMIIKLKKVYSS